MRPRSSFLPALVVLVLGLTSCGSVDSGDGVAGGDDQPTVVVTTNILGDVVSNLVGDQVEVVTIMPVGADPHEFQASARQVDQIQRADALIVNGAGFEEGLLDVIDSAVADGVPTFVATDAVDTLDFGAAGHTEDDDHADEDDHDEAADAADHDDEAEHGEEEHDHSGVDPHFFTDPARMVVAAEAIVEFLVANVDGIDAEVVRAGADGYLVALDELDGEVADLLAAVPEERRVLVTNHEVFGYFAERYGFAVVGTVIPGGSTIEGASAADLDELVGVIEEEGVPAIFADTSSSDELARTLADEVGEVEVVELFSESLGQEGSDGATYLDMVRANAGRISSALAG